MQLFGFFFTDSGQKDCLFLRVIGSICMRGADILQSIRVPRPPICKGLSGHPFPRSRGECLRGFRIKWAHLHGLVLKRQLEPGRRPGADDRGSRGTHCPPRGRHGDSIVRGAGLSLLPSVSPGPPPHPPRRLFSLAARIPPAAAFPMQRRGQGSAGHLHAEIDSSPGRSVPQRFLSEQQATQASQATQGHLLPLI